MSAGKEQSMQPYNGVWDLHIKTTVVKPAQLQCPAGIYADKTWGNQDSLQKQLVHEQFKVFGKTRYAKGGAQKYIHTVVTKHNKARKKWHLLSAEE